MSPVPIASVDGSRAASDSRADDSRSEGPHPSDGKPAATGRIARVEGLAKPEARAASDELTGRDDTTARPDWKTICRVDAIPRLGARRVRREAGADVAVFRAADDHVFALLDRCPHRGGPLSQGIVFGHSVACPLHNWTIELADGCARAPDVGCALTFAVRVDAGQVYLDAHELETRGTETDVAV